MHSFEFIKDALSEGEGFYFKKMFGGEALFVNSKMVLVIIDKPSTKWKNKDYGQNLWSGVMIPTFKEHHLKLIKKIPDLKPHPVLGKWLFLSSHNPNFEELCGEIVELILDNYPLIGIPVKLKL